MMRGEGFPQRVFNGLIEREELGIVTIQNAVTTLSTHSLNSGTISEESFIDQLHRSSGLTVRYLCISLFLKK
jgi:hypothetical protein